MAYFMQKELKDCIMAKYNKCFISKLGFIQINCSGFQELKYEAENEQNSSNIKKRMDYCSH